MHNLWNPEDQRLLERLKKYILSGRSLARPDTNKTFYTKIDCFKYRIGEVILQADVSAEAIKSEAKEKYSGKCGFYKSLEGMRLWYISFISISTV